MKILSGSSAARNAANALDEATQSWGTITDPIRLIILFHSTEQDSRELAAEIRRRYPGVPSIGCSTSGEFIDGKHQNGSLVISAVLSDEIRWEVAALGDVGSLTEERVKDTARDLAQRFGKTLEQLDSKRHFCLGFIDGLSMKEEQIASLIYDAFEGIPSLGGSSGDDLKFKETFLIANGECHTGAAVMALAESSIPFAVIKHQHFIRSKIDLVVTKVDAPNRRVLSFDGYPAAERYSRALGLNVSDLNPDVFSRYPLTFQTNNEIYVRSILRAEDDGSLKFYCALEEGMVLEIADHRSMEESLQADMRKLKEGFKRVDWFIACNCILRGLEASSGKIQDSLGRIISLELGARSIGFNTYGEQIDGLHINQTLVGIAFGEAA